MAPRVARTSSRKRAHVTDITIKFDKSYKLSKALEFCVDGELNLPNWTSTTDETSQWTFDRPVDISSKRVITVQPQKRTLFGKKMGDVVTILVEDLLQSCSSRAGEKREWTKTFPKIEISIGVFTLATSPDGNGSPAPPARYVERPIDNSPDSELPSTTDDIIRLCPRFRILVIGKSGVGKSSLINRAFGVDEASVSHDKPGISDINFEIHSSQNEHFVVHDSQGFEPGEIKNFNIVKNFIEQRKRKPELKDKLHAIWLCIPIPCSGGRVFEVGDENFIKLDLGHVPVIIVFTKLDQLVTSKFMNMDRSRRGTLNKEELTALARKDADATFDEICLQPLREVVAKEVLYMKVSIGNGYQDTLADLIKLTYDNVRKHVAEEPSLISAIAQRTSPDTKIEASIAVGRRRYWGGLATSINFPGKTLKRCLEVIHKDIVTVWNFHDPRNRLGSDKFKALMSNLVNDLADRNASNPNKGLAAGMSGVGTIAGIVAALSGPTAPIVVPIVAGVVLAKWAYDVYKQSRGILRCLMGYIVGLTVIMQNLFWLVQGGPSRISRRVIKLAFSAYYTSEYQVQIHNEINAYVEDNNIFHRTDRDHVLSKVVDLVERYRTSPSEMEKLKAQIDVTGGEWEDEPWVVSEQ